MELFSPVLTSTRGLRQLVSPRLISLQSRLAGRLEVRLVMRLELRLLVRLEVRLSVRLEVRVLVRLLMRCSNVIT